MDFQFGNMQNAPIFLVDDDEDEQIIIREIWKELDLNNELLFFKCGQDILDYLKSSSINPFLIICDLNLPVMDGFELRERLSEEQSLHYKAIPFVFWSTAASNEQIKKAYDAGGHGFFLKGENYARIKESLALIITYWKKSKAPILGSS